MATSSTAVIYNLIGRDHLSRPMNSASRSTDRMSRVVKKAASVVKFAGLAIAGAAAAGTAAAIAMGIKTAAALEQAQIGFESLLGSGKRARRFLGDLKTFAARTPFELPGLIDAARGLLGVGVEAKKVKPILSALGNTSAALGLDQERFGRVMTAVQQIMSKGKVQTEELLQISEAGIPIFQLLAKATGKPIPELQALMKAGKLTSDEVLPRLFRQMNKDYGGAMAKQSRTLAGLWSTFKDTLQLALADAVKPMIPALRKALPAAAELSETAIRGLGGAFGGVVPRIKRTIKFIGDFLRGLTTTEVGNISKFGKTLTTEFIPATPGEKAGARLRSFIRKLLDPKNVPTGKVGKVLGEALGKGIGSLSGRLAGALKKVDWVDVGKAVGGNAIGFAIGFLSSLFDDVFTVAFWKKHWFDVILALLTFTVVGKLLLKPLIKIFSKIPILKLFVPMLKKLEGFMRPFSDAVFGLLAFVGRNLLKGIRKVFPNFGRRLEEWLGELPTRIGLLAVKLSDKAKSMVKGLAKGIAKGAGIAVQAVGRLIGFVMKPFAKVGSWLLGKGKAFIGGLGRGISGAIKWLIALNKDVTRRVVGVFAKAGSWLVDSGRNIINGLRNGISKAMHGIKSWLKNNVFQPIVRGIKALFGIKSPSTVFAGFGRDMIRGLVKGLIKNDPRAFVSRVFGGTSKAAAKALGWLFENGKISFSSLMKLPAKFWAKFGGLLGFGGGNVGAGLAFAKAQNGEPYRWGGVGPSSWDCSGFLSAITNVMQGRFPYSRRFTTSSFAGGRSAAGFQLGARSGFRVGVDPGSHMAGSLYVGGRRINVESSGSAGVRVGGGARGDTYGRYTLGLTGAGSPSRRKGGVEGATFDVGGLARNAGLLAKATVRPERVLSPRQTESFERLVDSFRRQDARGGSSQDHSVTLTIDSGGNQADQLLLRWLRESIRVRGGNVELVLGGRR